MQQARGRLSAGWVIHLPPFCVGRHPFPFICCSFSLPLCSGREVCLVHSTLLWHFIFLQLSATNVSARTTMKGTANCDKHCELQISANQQELERKMRFRDIPESMPASVSQPLLPVEHLGYRLRFSGVRSRCRCVLRCFGGRRSL